MIHELKTHPEPFQAVIDGKKKFEVRRNDRDFKVGDVLILCEYDPNTERYVQRACEVDVTYVLPGGSYGVQEDYCSMSITGVRPVANWRKRPECN